MESSNAVQSKIFCSTPNFHSKPPDFRDTSPIPFIFSSNSDLVSAQSVTSQIFRI
jgi:hypothetical protein